MINLNREFCFSVREARRKVRLSQSALANELGCKQPALSMFEQGDGTKLNDEVVAKLAEKFGLELPRPDIASDGAATIAPKTAAQPPFGASTFQQNRGFCPNPHCPSNRRYEVEGRPLARPARAECDPSGGTFCAVCGEILEKKCPSCGAPVHDGAICTFCGNPYVAL